MTITELTVSIVLAFFLVLFILRFWPVLIMILIIVVEYWVAFVMLLGFGYGIIQNSADVSWPITFSMSVAWLGSCIVLGYFIYKESLE